LKSKTQFLYLLLYQLSYLSADKMGLEPMIHGFYNKIIVAVRVFIQI
jgi:hypothetical protein